MMPEVHLGRLIVAATSIGCLLLNIGLCSSQEFGERFRLTIQCQETDPPQIFQEEGSPFCWKCECFDGRHWGCFQDSGNCSNAVSPNIGLDFRKCNPTCDDFGICSQYGTGDLWIERGRGICWCDDGDSKCNIETSLAANVTDEYTTIADYRNSGIVCVKDEKLFLNFGDAILTNCSICTCINGSFWCSELDDCGIELRCPLVVADDCQLPVLELCKNDSQCFENSKCCAHGCLKECLEPVPAGSVTKPGACPDLQVLLPLELQTRCSTDYDCEDHLKCCNSGSHYVCLEPYNPNDCANGTSIVPCSFYNPCESTRCPKHPEARCRISHCGTCHAQYFINNERVNCFDDDVCDINTPLEPCILEEDCSLQYFYQPCPAAMEAECRLNYCGSCFYEFFNTTGDKIACFPGDPCPLGIEEFDCEHTCGFGGFCPEAAGANLTCVPTKCGGCGFPKFYYENGTEAQCFNLEDKCPENSTLPIICPDYCNDVLFSCTNPEAVSCQINYCGGECVSEYFNADGERVSCFGGTPCPPGQLETPFCLQECNTFCLAYPNATCEVNTCDFRCEEVFLDPETSTAVDCFQNYTCPEENPLGSFCNDPFSDFLFPGCFFMVCERHPDAKCIESPCGFCHAEFYIDEERVNCFGDIPCPPGIDETPYCTEEVCGPTDYCPADLSAICLSKQCGGTCEMVFQDLEGNIIEDCFSGIRCPSGVLNALCPYNLCETATCQTHPEAECRLNHCGVCKAQFFLTNGTEITHCSNAICADGTAPRPCSESLCNDISCLNYPNATCSVSGCGMCTAEFFSPEGTKLTDEDCGGMEREGFCPLEVVPSGLPCTTDASCEAPMKCCFFVPEFIFLKFCAVPEEVDPHSCEYEGIRYNHQEIRLEECQLCTCLLGQWSCYDTKCNLTCPSDAPITSGCIANDCSPNEQLCPAHPEARCTINPCGGCTVEHLNNETVVDCYDPDVLQCPEGQSPVPCEFNPCSPTCVSYPDAICRLNVCGSCEAEYVFDNRIVDCNEAPKCFYEGHEYTGLQTFRTQDMCIICICVAFNQSICPPGGSQCPDPLPCEEDGVEYRPLYARRENCTECVCSQVISGQFTCSDIPDCTDYVKDGACPPKQGSLDECGEEVFHECDHDGDCPASKKCCHEYCGSICTLPAQEGPSCFFCLSYFSDDIPNTEDTCSDVTMPNVDVTKCIFGMVCGSITAEATYNVLGVNPETNKSINVVQRGCYWPVEVPHSPSGCILGNNATIPRIYYDTEQWILQHEGESLIEDFSISACFCEEDKCNSVIPPPLTATTQPPMLKTTVQPGIATPTEGTTSSIATSPSTISRAATTQSPKIETTLQPVVATTSPEKTSTSPSTVSQATTTQPPIVTTLQPDTATTPETSTSPSTVSQAVTTPRPTTGTTLHSVIVITPQETNATSSTFSTATSSSTATSPTTVSQGYSCTLQGKVSNSGSFQSNPCSNCICTDGFFLCRFNGTCSADEVSYTLTGNFDDITGDEKQFARTLIQNLAKELTIDETVFLGIQLSAGSILVKQNVTDSKSVSLSAKEVTQKIREKVDNGMFMFTFNGKSYSSVSDTFENSQSFQFSSDNNPSNSAGVTIIIVVAAVVGVCLIIVVIIVVFKVLRKRSRYGEDTVLLRLSRSPSMNSTKEIGPVEFENPVYND